MSWEPEIEDARRLRIKANYSGYKSKTSLIERHGATAGYSSGEDVKSIVLDKPKTPWSVYTIADGMALQINAMPELLHVPLVLRRNAPAFSGHDFTLEFTGINSFRGNLEWFDGQHTIRYIFVEGLILALELTNSVHLR